MKSLLRILLLAALGVALSAAPSAAKSYKIVLKPSQLLPVKIHEKSGRTGVYVSGVGGSWISYACPLSIPAGKILTGLSFQHNASGPTIATVDLMRSNPGQTPAMAVVYEASNIAASSTGDFVNVVGTLEPGASKKVLKGWQYFVFLGISNSQGEVADIVVSYKDP